MHLSCKLFCLFFGEVFLCATQLFVRKLHLNLLITSRSNVMDTNWVAIIIISVIWGVTNPLLKKGAIDVFIRPEDTNSSGRNVLVVALKQLGQLISCWRYVVPFLLNLYGSLLLFCWLFLQSESAGISIIVPAVNALTFIFTACFSWLLIGEEIFTFKKISGLLCIAVGTYLCGFENR